ncbi:MAG: hypothetical protein Q7S92_02310 [Candidatus Diapherotrites archaeon]|nr:hypothetical protein [Candidatus Diapherotrites archaeon]
MVVDKNQEKIISSLEDLNSFVQIDWVKQEARKQSLTHYFASGGVIRIQINSAQEPTLVYPNKNRVKNLLETKNSLKQNYSQKLNLWQKKLTEAKFFNTMNELKKFTSPVFWKHIQKYFMDPEYKKHADSIQLPVALVNDPRYKPMIQMFVRDPDYRKQLVDTVQESVVYANNRKVAQFAEFVQDFRKQECLRRIKELDHKIAELNLDIQALQELNKRSLF